MNSCLAIKDKLKTARLNWHILDKRARDPRTDPRIAIEAEQERDTIARIIADLEEKIQAASHP